MPEFRRVTALLLLPGILLAGACSRSRTVALQVVADASFRSTPEWEAELRRRVSRTSEALDQQVRLRLSLVRVDRWEPASATSADELVASLRDVGPAPDADIVVGVYGSELPGGVLGDAVPFVRLAIITQPPARSSRSNDAVFLHELAHLFGAWHSDDRESVMHDVPQSLRFDPQSLAMLKLMRDFNFSKGIDQIDATRERRISALFAEGHSPGDKHPLAQSHTGQAIRLHLGGRLTDAIIHYREVVRIDPADATYRHNLGFALSEVDQLQAALAEFREAVRLDPASAVGHESLALALARDGQLQDAVKEFREALHYAPDKATTHFNLGLTLGHIPGSETEAVAEFRDAVRLKPDYLPAREALEMLLRRRVTPR